jgi:zinc protease
MSQVLDRTNPPESGTRPALKLPQSERFSLSNGLDVLILPRAALPEVSLRLITEAGAALEPERECGVAELTGRLLTEGAAGKDAMQMAGWLDRLGAAFTVSASYDVTMVSMHSLSDTLSGTLDYLAATAREPSFTPSETERVRQERLDEIERDRDEPSIVATRKLIAAIYGDHPYGRPSDGTYESVSGLDAESVRRFHHRHYTAEGAALIVCGDVHAERLVAELEGRFGNWTPGTDRVPLPEAPPHPSRPVSPLIIDRPASAQSEIRIGTIGAPIQTEDLYAATMGNAILGGLFSSRINMNLREDKGWTYGARSAFHFRRGAGPFVAQTAVETPVTADAVAEMMAEIRGMVSNPPSEEEMSLARNALTLSLPRQFETTSQVTGKLARQVIFGLPEDYWERYPERINAVTREHVVAVMERYLDPERLVFLVVGDAESIEPGLRAIGPTEVMAG